MKPGFDFEQDLLTLHVLPMVTLTALECSNVECGEIHGIGLEIGWLFWTARIGFPFAK